VIGLVVALVLGGSAFAVYKIDPFNLTGGGPAAAQAIPADALFYMGVDLDPAADQKVKAVQFLNHFPAFKNETNIGDPDSDIRKDIFEEALAQTGCDLSYDDDVEPWLGNKFALAGMPGEGDEPTGVFSLEVTDQNAAEDGLKKLAECAGEEYGVAFTGDYALVAETQDEADSYVDDVDSGSLADDGDFKADMDSIGDIGFASLWVDIDEAVKLFAPPEMQSGDLDFLLENYQRAAATVRFESDSVEIAASVFGENEPVDAGDNKIVDLPESTAFAVSLAGGEERITQTYDSLVEAAKNAGVDVEGQIADFEAETGLVLPEDLGTVLGDNIMMALDSEGLTADAISSEDPTQVNVGVRFTNDPDELNAIYDKVVGLIQQESGTEEMPVSKKDLDDGMVLASNDDYADKLSEDGGLGDSDAFTSVIEDAQGKEFVLYFNFDSIEPQIVEAMQQDGENQEAIENVTPIEAFGITSDTEGDYAISTLRMSVND